MCQKGAVCRGRLDAVQHQRQERLRLAGQGRGIVRIQAAPPRGPAELASICGNRDRASVTGRYAAYDGPPAGVADPAYPAGPVA